MSAHVIVIGGGIAGLSSAWQLALQGHRVTLCERESSLASHSSARNAAIWLPIDNDESTARLCRRSAELLDTLLGPGRWLRRTRALVCAQEPALLDEARAGLHGAGLRCTTLSEEALAERLPPLAEDIRGKVLALSVEGAGELEIHRMIEALASASRKAGAKLLLNSPVKSILERSTEAERSRPGQPTESSARAVRGVLLESGEVLVADRVVIASGAWAAAHGAEVGAKLPLVPYRRHLAHLQAPLRGLPGIVWELSGRFYYRPESGGILASPCDQQPWPPSLPNADPVAIERLGQQLGGYFPTLGEAGLRRSWACLRTFAADAELVIGPDPRLAGLYWIAGLGGRGMSVGVAAGELLARLVSGERPPLTRDLSPERFIEGR